MDFNAMMTKYTATPPAPFSNGATANDAAHHLRNNCGWEESSIVNFFAFCIDMQQLSK